MVGIGAAAVTWLLWRCFTRVNQKSKGDEVEITKISKIHASGSESSVSSETKGNGHNLKKNITANGKDNPAYQGDEKTTNITAKDGEEKVINEQPRLKPNVTYERQISDVSGISNFTLPASDNKGLTEMVLEEIERSFSRENTVREPENSYHDQRTDIKDDDYEDDSEILTPARVTSESTVSVEKSIDAPPLNQLTSTESEMTSEILTEISAKEPENPSTSQNTLEQNKELEWRNKLIQDLEDDEEFPLSSDEEQEDNEKDEEESSESKENENDADTEDQTETEVNENMKYTNGLSRENSTQSETIKCGGVPIVMDIGSYEIRAGVAGEYKPSHSFRNVLGKWRPQVGEAYSEAFGEILYGENALLKHNALSLHYPFQDGNVTDWKDVENIVDWTLCQCLDVDIKEHPLLITEPALVSKSQREKLLEVVMESLHCPMTRFEPQAVLSALAAGSDVALVVNSGHSCTEIVPVYYGHAVHHAVQRVNVGGQHITEYLGRLLLKERGINFSSVADHLLLDSIKQTYAEIRSDESFPTEAWNNMIHHELPDGGILELGAEIYKCTEPLYKPELIGDSNGPGLIDAIKQAVKGVDADMRLEMKSSVLLTGGNCHLKGFRKQLAEKLFSGDRKKSKSSPKNSKSWHTTKCHDLDNATWIGGSVYADRDDFRASCVTDDLYFEWGSSIVHRMCF